MRKGKSRRTFHSNVFMAAAPSDITRAAVALCLRSRGRVLQETATRCKIEKGSSWRSGSNCGIEQLKSDCLLIHNGGLKKTWFESGLFEHDQLTKRAGASSWLWCGYDEGVTRVEVSAYSVSLSSFNWTSMVSTFYDELPEMKRRQICFAQIFTYLIANNINESVYLTVKKFCNDISSAQHTLWSVRSAPQSKWSLKRKSLRYYFN